MTPFYEVALTVIAIIGAVAGGVAWFYKRGGSEREMTLALNQNTQATSELTTAFHSFREEVVDDIHALDIRMTKVEARIDRRPADRNPCP